MPKGIPNPKPATDIETTETNVTKEVEKIEVSKSDLQKVQDLIEAQAKKMEEQSQQIELLTKAANKQKMDKLTPKGKIGKAVKVTLYRGNDDTEPKVVVGWRTLTNISHIVMGQVVEDQTMELQMADGSTAVVKVSDFHDRTYSELLECDLEKTIFNYDETTGTRRDIKVACVTYNDKEYLINATYLNR